MIQHIFKALDTRVRALAYDVICRRDRCSGWAAHRNSFRQDALKDSAVLDEEVLERLRSLLTHACETSPYYRRISEEIGFSTDSFSKLSDLERFPFLTKDIIKANKNSLASTLYPSNQLDLDYTGGTTGTQTSFYRDHVCTVARFGRQWGILDLCGYRPGMRRALVWGVHDDLPSSRLKEGLKQRFRRYASSQETLCCTVMSKVQFMDFHGKLLQFKPDVLYGYPSALVQFGRFVEEHSLAPIRFKTIITTAERLSDANRRKLTRLFGAEVFNLYCTREYGCIGFECSKHQGFHIDTGSVYVEIVKDGRPVAPGQTGEIVITDLLNFGMPFIRSRTGDTGILSPQPCECRSPLPVLKGLDGRVTDLVYRPDGSVVPGLMLTDLFMDMPSIQFAQFVQESVNELVVFLVVTSEFSDEIEREAIRQVRELMGWEIAVHIRHVSDIERNPRSGKFREVICKIGMQEELKKVLLI